MKSFCNVVRFTKPVYTRSILTSTRNSYCTTSSSKNVIKSQLPPVIIPEIRVDEFLLRNAHKWGNKTAVVCSETGRSYTFDQYQEQRDRLSQALCAKLGFKKHDVIAVLLPNVPEYVTLYLGAWKAGLVLTPINPIYTPDEIARQLKAGSAKAIVTLTTSYSTVEQAIHKLQINERFPIITIKHKTTDVTPRGAIDFKELCEYNGPQVKMDSTTASDLCILPYSSGTSGLPKGVELLHSNIVADVAQLQQDLVKLNLETTNSHQDVLPLVAPMFHCYGLIPIFFNMFSEGCKTVFLPKYTPNLFIDLLEKYPPHIIHVVPPILLMLINNEQAKKHIFKNTRHMVSSAAPLADLDIERFLDKFGRHFKSSQYYGLTETGPVTHTHRMDRPIVPGSIGGCLSQVECRVVDVQDETRNLGPNETGHLLVRGPQVMPRYHNNPQATAETIDQDGWLRTGDIAHYDENEVFFITDRIKELIKVKGHQVAPAELEALIRDHPDVEDAAVTGVAHPLHGEAPKAFVVPRRGSNLKAEHVQDYVKEKAAKYKQLTGGVVFVDDIPKNPSGKILRRMLKDL